MLEQTRRETRDLGKDTSVFQPITEAGTGGLNLVDGALTTALSDSQIAHNVVVGNDGVLRRRPGTRYLRRIAQLPSGLVAGVNRVNNKVFTTPSGHDFLISRVGNTVTARHLRAESSSSGYIVKNSTTPVLANSGSEEGSILILRDPRIRILITVPTSPTLEIRVTELRVPAPASGRTVSFPRADLEQLVPGVYDQQFFLKEQLAVFVNGLRQAVGTLTLTSTTVTATLTPESAEFATGQLVDFVLFQSYWWGEAELYYGDRFCDSAIRTNLEDKDVHVSIPSNLRDAIERRGNDIYSPHTLDILRYTGSLYAPYSQATNGKPVGADQFSFSDGAARVDDSPVIPSPLFATFGAYESGVVRPVIMHRHRRLNHFGGAGLAGNDSEVYVDDKRYIYTGSAIGTGTLDSFRLWNDTDTTQVSIFNQRGQYISLDGRWASQPQVNPSSVVKIIAFKNNYAPPGIPRVPAYGLTTIADYGRGSFPSCAATYQNRLAIAGMPHDPLLIAFSALYDSRTPQEPYMYFQNDPLDLSPETEAFQVRIDSSADDRIISLQEFQGSLFAITYRGVFRVAAPGRTTITSNNYFVSSVASVGATSPNAICRPEGGIAFLSPRGLFAIVNGVQSNEATEYKLVELSTKIAPIFDSSLSDRGPARLWWASYASEERRIYIGVSGPNDVYHASRMYTYDILSESWASMDTVGGFKSYQGFDGSLERDRSYHYLLVDRFTDGAFDLIRTGMDLHMDYQIDFPPNTSIDYEAPRYPLTETTVIHGRDPFTPDLSGYIYRVVAPMSPLTQVRDISVKLDGVELEPFDGYVKMPGNYIRITTPITGEVSLVVTHRLEINSDPFNNRSDLAHLVVAADGIVVDSANWTQDSSQVIASQFNRWTWGISLVGDFDQIVGVAFQSVWASAVNTLGQITTDKRVSAITMYTERVRGKSTWYGTRVAYNSLQWPVLEVDSDAGTQPVLTDMPYETYDALVGLLTDQESTISHPLNLTTERDFLDPGEELSINTLPRPPQLQSGLGVAVRRTFSDIVSVFQLVVVSRGARPFGISAIQVEAQVQNSKQVHRSR